MHIYIYIYIYGRTPPRPRTAINGKKGKEQMEQRKTEQEQKGNRKTRRLQGVPGGHRRESSPEFLCYFLLLFNYKVIRNRPESSLELPCSFSITFEFQSH